jgi:hypothetical protein
VRKVGVKVGRGKLTLQLEGEGDLLLERWALSRKTGLLARALDRTISVSA